MWNSLRSFAIWLHEPRHVARFQQYFGILPKCKPTSSVSENNLNKNNNNNRNVNNNNNNTINDDYDEKKYSTDEDYDRIPNEKVNYDSSVLDECIEEIKHSSNQNGNKEKHEYEVDYKVTSWFWYYFFQFGSSLGNEIFYILFFPIW